MRVQIVLEHLEKSAALQEQKQWKSFACTSITAVPALSGLFLVPACRCRAIINMTTRAVSTSLGSIVHSEQQGLANASSAVSCRQPKESSVLNMQCLADRFR